MSYRNWETKTPSQYSSVTPQKSFSVFSFIFRYNYCLPSISILPSDQSFIFLNTEGKHFSQPIYTFPESACPSLADTILHTNLEQILTKAFWVLNMLTWVLRLRLCLPPQKEDALFITQSLPTSFLQTPCFFWVPIPFQATVSLFGVWGFQMGLKPSGLQWSLSGLTVVFSSDGLHAEVKSCNVKVAFLMWLP